MHATLLFVANAAFGLFLTLLTWQDTLANVVQNILSDDRNLTKHFANLQGKRVLLRADLNLPVNEDNGCITDATRLMAVLPTIQMLLDAGCKVIIATHFGRPSPKKQTWKEMQGLYSLARVADALAQQLGSSFVGLAQDCVGSKAQAAVEALNTGQALLLENTRFYTGETDNDPAFAAQLASLADAFVCDAFGVVHRDQASVTGVVNHVPIALPGPLIRQELNALMGPLLNPKRPLCVVIGGAKVADKLGVLWSLIPKADVILIGGRMAFTFLAAQGVSVGATQIEHDRLKDAEEMLALAQQHAVQMLLPCDVRVSGSLEQAQDMSTTVLTRTCCTPNKPCIPQGQYGIDIGPASEEAFVKALASCKTIFWNGPMGKYEVSEFASGTVAVAKGIAQATTGGAITIVGGGDSAAAVSQFGLSGHYTHISTGGGASLELLEGKVLPGLAALAGAKLP